MIQKKIIKNIVYICIHSFFNIIFVMSGSGSFYDLRHFSLPGIAPNVARYHIGFIHLAKLSNSHYTYNFLKYFCFICQNEELRYIFLKEIFVFY